MKNKIILLFVVLASASGYSQGGFLKTTQQDTITNGFVAVQGDFGTIGVWLDSLLTGGGGGGSDGNGIYSASNDDLTSAVDTVDIATTFKFLGSAGYGAWLPAGNNTLGGGILNDKVDVWVNNEKGWLGSADGIVGYIEVDTFTKVRLQADTTIIQGKPLLANNGTVLAMLDGNAGDTVYMKVPQVLTSGYTLEFPSTGPGANGYVRTYNTNGASAFVDPLTIGNQGTVTGTGSTNTVPKWTSATAIGNSNITDDGISVTMTSSIDEKPAAVFQNDNIGSLVSVVKVKNGGGFNQDLGIVFDNTNTGDSLRILFNGAGVNTSADFYLNNGANGGFSTNLDRFDILSTATQVRTVTPGTIGAITAANGDITHNNSTNTDEFKLDDAFNFYEQGKWVDRLERHYAAEVSGTSETISWKECLPVNATSNNVTLSIPSGVVAGDWFEVTYSRSAAANTITVDFVSATYNYYGASANATIAAPSTVRFEYINSTIGFVAH